MSYKLIYKLLASVFLLTLGSCSSEDLEEQNIEIISCEINGEFKVCYDINGNPVDSSFAGSTISLLTWNIQDLGGTKDEIELLNIAEIIKDYDLIAIQEVVGLDPAGAKAVSRIVDNLNRMGSKWDYSISDRTKSPSGNIAERYAFIWKPSRITLVGKARLLSEVEDEVWREPYYGRFKADSKIFDVINLHARTNSDNPIPEINSLIQELLIQNEGKNWVLMGDFNTTEVESVWNQLYNIGYMPAVWNSPTTLKRSCKGTDYLNYSIDNIFYDSKRYVESEAQVVDFVRNCSNLEISRMLSDHLPVGMSIE